MDQINFLLKNVTGPIDGDPIELDTARQTCRGGYGVMPIQLWGIGEATVKLQASQSHEDMDAAKRDGVLVWTDIIDGTFTKDTCSSLSVAYPYIRAVVLEDYISGTINMTIGL